VLAFVDHGADGTGEPLAALLGEGRANANNAGDQIAVVDAALAQLPEQVRGRVLVRGDAAAGVRALLHHLSALGLPHGNCPQTNSAKDRLKEVSYTRTQCGFTPSTPSHTASTIRNGPCAVRIH
jgi:hypothetical protein